MSMGQHYNNRGSCSRQQPVNIDNRPLPQALEIEKAVLGAQMIDRDAYALVSDDVRKGIYHYERHQTIQDAIDILQDAEKPVDILTVTEQLKRMGKLEEVGGPVYIAELSSKVASSSNIKEHARILLQKNTNRRLIAFGDKYKKLGYDETEDVEDVLEQADADLQSIREILPNEGSKPFNDHLEESVQGIQKAAAQPDGITGVATFRVLDDVTAGYQDGDLIIIAARPAMGKTSFALSCAKVIAIDHRIPTAFFSLEMSAVQLTNRIISNVCKISGKHILSGQLDREEWDRLDKRINLMYNAPLYIDDSDGITIGEFRARAKRLVRENGVKIIFIDYLQLMHADGRRFGTRQEEVSAISESLKKTAKELNIPVIALSQLNRTIERREGLEGKRPQLSDLRESGAIEQDADLVIFIHRPDYYGMLQDENGRSTVGKAEILISKNRKGSTKTAPGLMMDFRGEFTCFEEEDDNRLT